MSFTTFKGMDDFGDKTMSEIVSENIVQFLDWGFLEVGAFYNVNIPTSGVYGVDRSQLRMVRDPRFNNGQVWESANKNWIWQSGVSHNPIQVSGVYVNGAFKPLNSTGTYAHYIDYPNGRVVFSTAIPTNSTVKVEYSYKTIEISDIQIHPFFMLLQQQSYRNDNSQFQTGSGGVLNQAAETRMQVPSIAVETPSIRTTEPYSLGTGARFGYVDVKLHVFGENIGICRRIADVLVDQKEKQLFLFDSNEIANSGAYPLDSRGSIKQGALTYPQMLTEQTYRWRKFTILDTEAQQKVTQISPTLYHTVVKCTVETVITQL